MANTVWKVGKRDDSASVEVYDNDGTMELLIDGTKVLTEQQTAIGDSVGSDEVAKINAILAALRAHGLIAT